MTLKANAVIDTQVGGRVVVNVIWTGANIDRPSTGGISCGSGAAATTLAVRLVRAINAQVVYDSPRIMTDVNGKTYVEAGCAVMGRRLNADLKRLGF